MAGNATTVFRPFVSPKLELTNRLEAGEFDFIAVGRTLIADPEWATKLRQDRLIEAIAYGQAAFLWLNLRHRKSTRIS